MGPEEATKVTIKGAEGLNVVIRDEGLLPCPFCNNKVEIKQLGGMWCILHLCPLPKDKKTKADVRVFGFKKQGVISEWNKRKYWS